MRPSPILDRLQCRCQFGRTARLKRKRIQRFDVCGVVFLVNIWVISTEYNHTKEDKRWELGYH